jgi:hypothetical protein
MLRGVTIGWPNKRDGRRIREKGAKDIKTRKFTQQ